MSSDLDLDALVDAAVALIPRATRGRPGMAPTYLRDIQLEDLATVQSGKAVSMPDRPITKLRHTHHLAARLLAEGKSQVETAMITGYTPVRIQQLLNDPTFNDLVSHYRDEVDAKWMNVQERLAALGMAVTEEMQERLDTMPEKFSNEDLRKWAETLLDRSGNGPSATRNINVKSQSLTLSLIERIKLENEDGAVVKQLAAE